VNARENAYNAMAENKWGLALDVLKVGVNAFMIDPDVAMLRNPLPYMETLPECDMYTMMEGDSIDGTADEVASGGGYHQKAYEIMYDNLMNTGYTMFRAYVVRPTRAIFGVRWGLWSRVLLGVRLVPSVCLARVCGRGTGSCGASDHGYRTHHKLHSMLWPILVRPGCHHVFDVDFLQHGPHAQRDRRILGVPRPQRREGARP
jgi:hypothetical protein